MKRALKEFGAKLEAAGKDSVGLFYYAGHGVQLNGRNFLIPTKASIEREGDVEIEAVSAEWVLEQMRFARNRLNIVILDACRNNPFARGMRSADRGLAKMDAPAGTLIAYSTAPGDVAEDGKGTNSPYTQALAKAMREGRQPIEQVFKRTRISVRNATSEQQTPWESSSLTGDFYFTTSGPAVSASAPPAAVPSTGSSASRDAEVAYWQGMQNSSDADDFRDYLKSYPNGLFAQLARNRIASLTKKASTPPPAEQRVAAAPKPEAPKTRSICAAPVGYWTVPNIPGEVLIKSDQTLEWWKSRGDKLPSVTGTWTCDSEKSRRFVLTWGHGSIDTVTLADDSRTLRGRNQLGLALMYNRAR
jgi:uncharacterized caspase-like protein